MNNSVPESTKISKIFHAKFLRLLGEAEKKRNFELSRGNALKIKSSPLKKTKNNGIEPANLKKLRRYSKRK